jgi:hypothetical protein
MQATLSFHFGFVTAPIAAAVLRLILLHCDKISSFGHIEAARSGFLVQALIVSGDNGLNGCGEIDAARRVGAASLVPASGAGGLIWSNGKT